MTRPRGAALGALIALGLGLAAMTAGIAAAQTPSATPPLHAPGYVPPKLKDGRPDLQGMWSNASITHLQRAGKFKDLVLSKEDAAQLEGADYYNNRRKEDAKPADVKNLKLLDGSDLLSGGGYNGFWVDPGSKVGEVRGTLRSSWIVEPADGRIPYKQKSLTAAQERARDAAAAAAKAKTAGGTVQGPGAVDRNAGGGPGSYDGPETRPVGERCLIGFGGTGGPVMQNVLYNNTYQIVQAPDHVVIDIEMVHDARIIPLTKDRKRPSVIQPWLGDSIGWYEGDTLVVETRNLHPQQRGFIGPAGKVTERFTRWSDNQILYEFAVEDPTLYTQPWKGEMSLNKSAEPVREYACHEGNYAMPGILAGARKQEREGKMVRSSSAEEGG